MIIKYGVSNFLSFNKYVEFSMLAPGTKVKKRFQGNYVSLENGYDVNKTAVIVGENAGGKSNYVRSIEFFISLFVANKRVAALPNFLHVNNAGGDCPKEMNTTQRFFLEATDQNDGFFIYSLEMDFVGIVRETLEYGRVKGGSKLTVLDVQRSIIESRCDDGKCDKGECRFEGKVSYQIKTDDAGISQASMELFGKTTSENDLLGLFVTKIALLGSKPAIRFVSIVCSEILPDTDYLVYDIYKRNIKEKHDVEIINDSRFFEIFRIVDYSIVGIEINEEDPFVKSKIIRKNKKGTLFSRKLSEDSSGVREFFAWAIQVFKVIYEDKIVIADEMDRVLNPVLSDRVVALINGSTHKGQFIFTSHNVLHLDLRTYMKEQIYFISKDIETLESDLYSLADFQDVRYDTAKIYEFYLKGILGGTSSEC